MSKTTNSMDLRTIEGAREFIDGLCPDHAERMIAAVGAITLDTSEFGIAIDKLDEAAGMGPTEDEVREIVGLLQRFNEGELKDAWFNLDVAHNEAMQAKSQRAYLFGLAVGCRLGPGFLEGGNR